MISTARKIVNGVVAETGHNHTIFNDRLSNGDRSFKIWGLGKDRVAQIKQRLESAGFEVKLVITPKSGSGVWASGGAMRLHVAEKNAE